MTTTSLIDPPSYPPSPSRVNNASVLLLGIQRQSTAAAAAVDDGCGGGNGIS
jgi:hypothetical protein